jgi:phenylacetate-CoA ligase
VRAAIEGAWRARVLDHSGATEVGPWGFGDATGAGLWINEAEFIAEFFAVDSSNSASNEPAQPGELAELVLTNLGRVGCPLLRYRTGDLVRPAWDFSESSRFVFLTGGVLGRADDMLIIRGVNIFPSSIDEIVRQFPEVAEYRVTASTAAGLDQLLIEVEDAANRPERIAQRCETQLGLRVEVATVPAGTLPRFEAKSARFIDQRRRGD